MSRLGVISAVSLALGLAACGGGGGGGTNPPVPGEVTFWQDVAPIYNTKCVRCHQEGGIGPFRLDNYADAKTYAAAELARVNEGTMPPYFMVHDDSCGSFQDDATLTAAEKATIAAWVDGGAGRGHAGHADAADQAGAGGRARNQDADVRPRPAGRCAGGVRRLPLLPARPAEPVECVPHRLRRRSGRCVDRPPRPRRSSSIRRRWARAAGPTPRSCRSWTPRPPIVWAGRVSAPRATASTSAACP